MPTLKNDDIPELLQFRSPTDGSPPKETSHFFEFSADDGNGPEMELMNSGRSTADATPLQVSNSLDLSAKKKAIFWVGRGKTGKTTGIRWLSELALAKGTPLLMADMDATNNTFSRYIANVARPTEASDPTVALKCWMGFFSTP